MTSLQVPSATCAPVLPRWKLLSLPLPTPPSRLAARLLHLETLLASLPSTSRLCLPTTRRGVCELGNWSPTLEHKLSAYMGSPADPLPTVIQHEAHEAQVYAHWKDTLTGPVCFQDLVTLNARSTEGSSSIRVGPSYLVSRDRRVHLPMVHWRAARRRLESLPELLVVGELGSGLLLAIRALALVVNAHAFEDGNGRLGRFLFNYCLHLRGMPIGCYVPLKTMAALANGGYEIRLREAIFFNRWDALIEYHCQVTTIALSLVASSTSAPDRIGLPNVQ